MKAMKGNDCTYCTYATYVKQSDLIALNRKSTKMPYSFLASGINQEHLNVGFLLLPSAHSRANT